MRYVVFPKDDADEKEPDWKKMVIHSGLVIRGMTFVGSMSANVLTVDADSDAIYLLRHILRKICNIEQATTDHA